MSVTGVSAEAEPVLWTRPDLEAALSLGRTKTYELINRPDFPRGVRLFGENSPRRWYASEVMAYVAKLPR